MNADFESRNKQKDAKLFKAVRLSPHFVLRLLKFFPKLCIRYAALNKLLLHRAAKTLKRPRFPLL